MSQLDDLISQRRKKRNELRSLGENPYPAKTKRTHSLAVALASFGALSKAKKKVSLAGRIMLARPYGAITFMKINDGTGEIQFLFRMKELPEKQRAIVQCVDIGDFISATGVLLLSKTGEKTLEVSSLSVLAKALRPLPDKWHGLADVEERFRRRYLDTLMDKDVKARFELRAKIVTAVRSEFVRDGFLEVETPILQGVPAGAAARPFKTHLTALDIPLYLRIAPELYLKELLVGGYEKVVELGRLFRNEGMDTTHNPEFTSVEGYWAYQDAEGLMKYLERFLMRVLDVSGIGRTTHFREHKITWKAPIARKDFRELVKQHSGIDIAKATMDEMHAALVSHGIEPPKIKTEGEYYEMLFKKLCQSHLIQPTFVTGHPLALSPLAKAREDGLFADRFQLVVGGFELINAYSELNDPEEQAARFEKSQADVDKGSGEAQRGDEEFVEALEYGMPPAAGFGIGIDRLVMVLTNASNIREVILFPTMRPKDK